MIAPLAAPRVTNAGASAGLGPYISRLSRGQQHTTRDQGGGGGISQCVQPLSSDETSHDTADQYVVMTHDMPLQQRYELCAAMHTHTPRRCNSQAIYSIGLPRLKVMMHMSSRQPQLTLRCS